MVRAADPSPSMEPIGTAAVAAATGLTWEEQGGRWFAEIEGREHDYGDGSGPDQDVFTVILSPLAEGEYEAEIEHETRGSGAETAYLRGALPQVQAAAERLLREFRQRWEEDGSARTPSVGRAALRDAAVLVADQAPAPSLGEPEPYTPKELREAAQGFREVRADAERALAQAQGMTALAGTARHAPIVAAAEEMCRAAEALLQATAADGKVDDEAVEAMFVALTAFEAASHGLSRAAAALDAAGD